MPMPGNPPTGSDEADGETPRNVRILQIIVVVLGIILIVGMATVIGRIAYLMMRPASEITATAPYPDPETPVDLALPGGSNVTSISLDGSQLAVHYTGSQGAGIAVMDLKTGRIIRRLRIATPIAGDKNDNAEGSRTTDPPAAGQRN